MSVVDSSAVNWWPSCKLSWRRFAWQTISTTVAEVYLSFPHSVYRGSAARRGIDVSASCTAGVSVR